MAQRELSWSVNLMAKAPVADVVAAAVAAEELGYDRCWVFDEGVMTRDVFVTLTAIAGATSRISIGPGITNPYVRHPGATAAAIASLDEVSGGRAFLGIGPGGGLALGPLALDRVRPLAAVADTVAACRALFAGEQVTMEGATFALAGARMGYARPDIEIIVAGRSPRITELGGRIGDGFYLSFPHKELLDAQVVDLRDAADGRPFHVVWSTAVALSDADVEQVRTQLTFRLVDSPVEVRHMLGLDDTRREQLRDAIAQGGPPAAAHLVDTAWVEQFAVVGDAASAHDEIVRRCDVAGVDEFMVPVNDVGDLSAMTALAPSTT